MALKARRGGMGAEVMMGFVDMMACSASKWAVIVMVALMICQ